MTRYAFTTTCVNSRADLILDMVDQAREVTWTDLHSLRPSPRAAGLLSWASRP